MGASYAFTYANAAAFNIVIVCLLYINCVGIIRNKP